MIISLLNKRTLLTPAHFSKLIHREMSHIQSPALLKVNDTNRVFFSSRSIDEKSGEKYISRIYYVDFDTCFSKISDFSGVPIAQLGELGTFDQHGTNPLTIINFKDKTLMYYVGWSRSKDVPYTANIGLLQSTSESCKEFERLFSGPVISFDQDEPFLLGSPRVKEFNGILYMWYVSGKSWNVLDGQPEPTYKIRMATSIDGVHWQKIGRDLIQDSIDENECQAAPEVISLKKGFLMIYSFRSNSRTNENSEYQVNFAYSDDLLNWTTEPIDLNQPSKSPSFRNTSYYNLFRIDHAIQALFQLEKMGQSGIGIGTVVVDEKK
jgi:hypothetical protein